MWEGDDSGGRAFAFFLRPHPGAFRQLNTETGRPRIDHFTVVCSVTWPLNGSEAGGDLVLIQTTAFVVVDKI